MTGQIQPALSPRQWKGLRAEMEDQNGIYIDDDPREGVAVIVEYTCVTEQRHALAALCLHHQPYGFTQGDVDNLRHVAVSPACGPMRGGALLDLADRIQALLPPLSQDPAFEGEDGG